MTPLQNAVLASVFVIGIGLIAYSVTGPWLTFRMPEFRDACADIGASYIGHGLCAKPDGSVWSLNK